MFKIYYHEGARLHKMSSRCPRKGGGKITVPTKIDSFEKAKEIASELKNFGMWSHQQYVVIEYSAHGNKIVYVTGMEGLK